jgi:GT2 family glycosyltransferase
MSQEDFDTADPGAHEEPATVEVTGLYKAEARPGITVVVPVRNAWVHVATCLASLESTIRQDDRLVIVDDGSGPEVARSLRQLPGVEVIRHEAALGPAAAYNAGAAVATTDAIVFLHSDTIVTPGWLDRLVPPLFSEGVVATGPRSNRAPGHQLIMRPEEYNPTSVDDVWALAETWRVLHLAQQRVPRFLDSFCLAVRRDAFEAVGGFDEGYELNAGEDTDLTLRLHNAGGLLLTIDDAFVHHVGGGSHAANDIDRDQARRVGFARLRNKKLLAPPRPWPTPMPEQEDMLEVSVLVPTLNRPTLLGEALTSIREQMWYGVQADQVEIIVINDGGIAVDAATGFAGDHLAAAGPQVRILDQPKTGGRAAALNAGLRAARGRHITVLNDDQRMLPHHLGMLLDTLRRGGEGTVASSLAIQTSDASDGHGGVETSRVLLQLAEPSWESLQVANLVGSGTWMVRAADLRLAGGWDENYLINEDWELHLRLADSLAFNRIDVPTVESNFRGADNARMRLYARGNRETLDLFDQHPTVPGDVVDENREIVRSAVRTRTSIYSYDATIAIACRADLIAAVKTLRSAGEAMSGISWEILLLVPSGPAYREIWSQIDFDFTMISIGHDNPRTALRRAEELRGGRVLLTAVSGELIDAGSVARAIETPGAHVQEVGYRAGRKPVPAPRRTPVGAAR